MPGPGIAPAAAAATWPGTASKMRAVVNRVYDASVRPEIRVQGHAVSAFRICGCTGLAVAVVLTAALVRHDGLSMPALAAIALAAVAVFITLALAVKVITGIESLTYYHHQFAVLAAAAGLSACLGRPVLPYLDVTSLGVGAFLVFGRVGCLLVGCCHGKPSRWGPRYRTAHVEAGFPACYAGVRLLPVQLLEAAWVAIAVLVGTDLFLRGSTPGTTLGWYLMAYACGRFGLEFLRGDWGRPYLWGFSEAQWTSLILVAGVAVAGWAGRSPAWPWPSIAATLLAAIMAGLGLRRRATASVRHRLVRSDHFREVVEILRWLPADPRAARDEQGIAVVSTSLGIRLSAGAQASGIRHYTVSSSAPGGLDERCAGILADLICRAGRPAAGREPAGREFPGHQLVAGAPGVFHILIDWPRPDLPPLLRRDPADR
jgi:Prolipoprotein diacylglyceryl transferase